MRKYTKEELCEMQVIDVYKMVLKGDVIKRFPKGFWQQPEAKQNAAKCTKYLIEEILKYDEEMLKEKNSIAIFKKNKLGGMIQTCFDSSPYKCINYVYPNKYKEWEFACTSNGYWDSKENGIKATKWLIEDKLKLNDKELKEQLSSNLFKNNKLMGMLECCFNGSPYEAINNTYPNKYKEWEFKCVPKFYWDNKENGIKATKWLIEDKLKLNDEELKEQLNQALFKKYGLDGMLQHCFNSSPYQAINSVYPNKYKEWEFRNVPKNYWNEKENTINAIRWLIERKLNLSDNEIKEKLSVKLFKEYRLEGMLKNHFNGSPYEAINSVYPNKYKEWEFRNVPKCYWDDKENGVRATKWLIEEQLKLNDEELKEKLNQNLFKENGLDGMLQYCFNGSSYEAINSVYPNKYKYWDFKCIPKGYWDDRENGKKATRWLIEEKLRLNDDEIKNKLSAKLFKENRLDGMLKKCFNGSPYEAINSIYPNKFKKTDFKGY